jgi:hypothetical protein
LEIVVVGGVMDGGLSGLFEAAVGGIRAAGGEPVEIVIPADPSAYGEITERVLSADALLVAAPVRLSGLPGTIKAWFDSWLGLVPGGRLVARTARMRAGYVATYEPDDPAIPELFHAQMRALFSFFGMTFRGQAMGFCAPGAAAPRDASLPAVAERLGAVLCGEPGYAGYPMEYVTGIRLFNEGEFWEAHEAWEPLWLEAEEGYPLFFQGLIQVAAALHHLGRENWGGMAALLRQAVEKLEGYRPRALGLDVEAFLDEVEPWRLLAEARDGRRPAVLRRPERLPRIALD